MSQGWIALDRLHIQENPLYFREPFDKFHCFLDLIVLANHSDSSFEKKGIMIYVKRGQLARSLVELADRWKRDRKTVRKIIFELKKDNELDSKPYPKKNPVTTIITLFRYDYYLKKYESRDNEKDNEKDTERDSERDTYNNDLQFKTISNKNETSNGMQINLHRVSQKNKSKNPLKAEEKDLIQDILTWAYDPENNFKIDKAQKETAEFLINTVRRYGIDAIQEIFDYCSAERFPWDKGLEDREGENVSAYSEFWNRIRGLK